MFYRSGSDHCDKTDIKQKICFSLVLYLTSCKYSSSGRRFIALRAQILSSLAHLWIFISNHQVAAAALLLLLLLLRAWFTVVRQMALTWIFCLEFCHEFYYSTRIDKWPWPWLKHSPGQHQSLCQVWSWSAQPFGRPSPAYRQTNKQTYRLLCVRFPSAVRIVFFRFESITGPFSKCFLWWLIILSVIPSRCN